jgi:hypothetical protein
LARPRSEQAREHQVATQFNRFKTILEKLGKVAVPALPPGQNTRANWGELFKCWFHETTQPFAGANWSGNELLTFQEQSPYSIDLAESVAMAEVHNQFMKFPDWARPNPWAGAWNFSLTDSARAGYYTIVEWFLGSFDCTINWTPAGTNDFGGRRFDVRIRVTNESTWHSATRFPKSWQDKIKEATGMEVKDLVTSAPRGKVGDTLAANAIRKSLGLPPDSTPSAFTLPGRLPSFGGSFRQTFNCRTVWERYPGGDVVIQ